MASWPISWWQFTGAYTPFVENRSSPILRNMATGEELSLHDLPFGACFDASVNAKTGEPKTEFWMPRGADGKSIVCITPRSTPPDPNDKGDWYIDSRANNCTMKDDDAHRCWVRHGTVGEPLHVDKAGLTCQAGAGSIQNAKWHGFLQNGVLRE